MTTKQYITFLREKRKMVPLVRGSRVPIMKQSRKKPRKCAQCKQMIEHPNWNQRVHRDCRRAWVKRYHAAWWQCGGAERQRVKRAMITGETARTEEE